MRPASRASRDRTRAFTISSTCSSIARIRCASRSSRSSTRRRTVRHLSVFAYNDWVIGPPRELDTRHVITDYDAQHQAVLAWNPYNTTFAGRVCFAACSERPISATGNRRSFIGRNGSMARPSALGDDSLTGEFGAGMDPCAALQIRVALEPGRDPQDGVPARRGPDAIACPRADRAARSRRTARPSALARGARSAGTRCSTRSRCRRPDDSFDMMMNRWLLYQSLSCRIWTRAGYYQPGGAYGFRDQLQDVMALLYADAAAGARAHHPRRRPAVRRRRRPALVARAGRPRAAQPLLRRSAVAAVRRRRIRARHRRHRRARRGGAVPHAGAAAGRRSGSVRPAVDRRARPARSSSTAAAPSRTASPPVRTACR